MEKFRRSSEQYTELYFLNIIQNNFIASPLEHDFTLAAAETHPRLLPTTLGRRRSSLRCGVITSAPETQSSSGCCPSGGDKQRGCRRAGRCRISSTRYDATPRAIVSSIESRTNGLVQENVWTSWLHGTHGKIQLPVIMLHL